ncbi:MAG: alpha-E domain-containing protein [Kiloniellaceae bacterium]
MSRLLSRYAEATYWMARYVERAENLARILDVNETFSRDSRGWQNWRLILQLYRDEERFLAEHGEPTVESVLYFYTLDQRNFTSIISDINQARSNARTLRPLISTEMWTQLNIFSNNLKSIPREDLSEPRLARFCNQVKEACQTHTGITEGTFYRDEGWFFYQIGRCVERADQTTRLLDVKYHLLLPTTKSVGSPLDVSHWNAVLRSAAGYHAFRRVHPSGMTAADAAGFLLFHSRFPRSVRACVHDISARLMQLRSTYRLIGGAGALEELDELRSVLDDITIDQVISNGMHEFIDWIQLKLIRIHGELGTAYFGYPAPADAAAQSAE